MAHILVIEDDSTLQEAYSFILKTGGHKVISAYNGKEGLAAASKEDFDVILLDILMPVMNGLEFLEQYQATRPANTKVIVFSNMMEPEIKRRATSLGAYHCVLKSSMTPGGMLSLIRETVKQ